MEEREKEVYAAPVLAKHELLRDITTQQLYRCAENEPR